VTATPQAHGAGVRLYPTGVRESPYLEFALADGATAAVRYNRMWLPTSFGRDPRAEYEALLGSVILCDVGCERALEVAGPDAVAFVDYLLTREIAALEVGRARHALALYEDGTILCEALVLRLGDDRVWVCHGPADFPSWARAIALHTDYRVTIDEAPVSPLALQGPRALDVMQQLAPDVASLPRFGWAWSSIAGEDVLVARTGWTGEFGYEVFATDDEPAKRVWREIRQAADRYGVLVTPVVFARAWERGITDIRHGDNLALNPFEVGLERSVELDRPTPFIGADRLRAIRADGPRRRTVNFVVDADDVPDHDRFWPVIAAGAGDRRVVGSTWHVLYSYALERYAGDAVIDVDVDAREGARLELSLPAGPLACTVVARPIVSG